jgi:hypothetical protein
MKTTALDALNEALYGSQYGFGERTLPLEMKSRTSKYFIKLPVTCRYKDNKPTFLFEKVTKPEWDSLCELVTGERVIKVMLNDGIRSYAGRLLLPGDASPAETRPEVSLRWQEYEEVTYVFKKGFEWLKKKLR